MEATHFLGVFTNPFHKWQTFTEEMKYGIFSGTYLGGDIRVETIAVWRIKPTDVPMQERLAARIGLIGGLCTPEGYGKWVEMNKAIKRSILFGIGFEPVLTGFKERITEEGSINSPIFETPYYAF